MALLLACFMSATFAVALTYTSPQPCLGCNWSITSMNWSYDPPTVVCGPPITATGRNYRTAEAVDYCTAIHFLSFCILNNYYGASVRSLLLIIISASVVGTQTFLWSIIFFKLFYYALRDNTLMNAWEFHYFNVIRRKINVIRVYYSNYYYVIAITETYFL